jgi:mediator of RNA polymerase II transcription subunit 9
MIRALIRYFTNTNSEKIIERLSDSYLMRRAAQMSVSLFYRAKAIAEEAKEERIKDMTPDKFRSFLDKFRQNIDEEIKKAKSDLESKNKP